MDTIMYGYIYITENLITGKKYIGKHRAKNTDNDGYLGSGNGIKRAIKKYGAVNFKREILSVTNSREELNLLEIATIAEYDAEKNALFYNMRVGGEGGFPRSVEQLASYAAKVRLHWKEMDQEQRAEISKRIRSLKGNRGNKDYRHNEINRQDISVGLRQAHVRILTERGKYKTEQGEIASREKLALHYTEDVRLKHAKRIREGQARRLAEYKAHGVAPPRFHWYHDPNDPTERASFSSSETIPQGWIAGMGTRKRRIDVVRVHELIAAGRRDCDIAREVGCTPSAVWQIRHDLLDSELPTG